MDLCAECGKPIAMTEGGSYYRKGPNDDIGQIYHATCGDPFGTKALQARIERLEAALQEIDNWSRAYPLKVFPEPDFQKAAQLLKSGGITLDAISASNMRHVVEGVGEIARNALSDEQTHDKEAK